MNDTKVCLITGGTRGIGLDTVQLLAQEDYHIYVVGQDFSKFELGETRATVNKLEFDLANVSGIAGLVDKIRPVDILINNAGIMNMVSWDQYPQDLKERELKVNLEAPVELIRQVSKGMVAKGVGRIVNVASIAGQIGHPDIWYGITKAGIINVTKSLAKILGPQGVVINCVAPSPVETDMLSVIPEKRKQAFKESVILNRFAKSKEVAETVVWLATQSPEYINGTCIDINNGSYMR